MSVEGFDPWLHELEEYFDGYGEPDEVWEGRASRNVQRRAMLEWLMGLADWRIFVTLTFREEREFDSAKKSFDRLVKTLNTDLFGKHYWRIVGGSYFSYALATEYQLREVIHFHFLADRPLHFRLLHDTWNEWAGIVWTDVIVNPRSAVRYVVKYMLKSEGVDTFKSQWTGEPIPPPEWWKLRANVEAEPEEGRALLGGPPA